MPIFLVLILGTIGGILGYFSARTKLFAPKVPFETSLNDPVWPDNPI